MIPLSARVAQRVDRGITLLCHDRALEGGEWSAARLGRTLPPRKTRYPFYRRLVPRGFQEVKFPDYVTMIQNGGKGVSLTHRPIFTPPGNTPGTHIC